jgi:hypothetical protein
MKIRKTPRESTLCKEVNISRYEVTGLNWTKSERNWHVLRLSYRPAHVSVYVYTPLRAWTKPTFSNNAPSLRTTSSYLHDYVTTEYTSHNEIKTHPSRIWNSPRNSLLLPLARLQFTVHLILRYITSTVDIHTTVNNLRVNHSFLEQPQRSYFLQDYRGNRKHGLNSKWNYFQFVSYFPSALQNRLQHIELSATSRSRASVRLRC